MIQHNDIVAMETLNRIAQVLGYGQWIILSPLEKSLMRITVQDYRNDPSVSDEVHGQARELLADMDAIGHSGFVERPQKHNVDSYASWDQRGGSRLEIW